MEAAAASSRRTAQQDIVRALASIDKTKANRYGARCAVPDPKFKPLVLRALPTASVRRIGPSAYECYVGEQRIRSRGCSGAHSTSHHAWVCLARFVGSRAFSASEQAA